MYSFRQIRDAVLAGGRSPGFPFEGALLPERLAAVRDTPYPRRMLDEVRADAASARETPIPPVPFSASLHELELAPGLVSWRGTQGVVRLEYDSGAFTAALEPSETREHQDRPIVVQRLRLHTTPTGRGAG